ncbi:MAG: hypothetical protein PUP92_29645 [Rhizonema sp. PD38]|nr:hypothetical protein [Rhizonema sp. PD38]
MISTTLWLIIPTCGHDLTENVMLRLAWLQPLILRLVGQAMVENFGHAVLEITVAVDHG